MGSSASCICQVDSPPPASQPHGLPPLHRPVPPPGGLSQDDLNLGMLCHLLAIFTGFAGPLILWLVKKDSSAYVDFHGKESLNFQITLFLFITILSFAAMILMFVVVGFALVPVIALLLLGAIK
jgi:uncharacterized Tic20 family protein